MSTNDDGIIDAEIVDDDRLPAVIERASNSEPIELPNRQDTLLSGNPDRRCVATNSRGERCRKFAIYGATVCRTHGGATKKVKEAARIRVENASNRLMGKLIEFAFDDTKPPDVQLKAIQNSLDRAGLKPPAEVVLSQSEAKPYKTVFDSIGGTATEESPDLGSGYGAAGHEGLSTAQRDLSTPDQPPPTHTQPIREPHPARENTGAPEQQQVAQSSADEPPPSADRRRGDRHTRPQARARHVTGEAAIVAANWANRAMAESHGLPWGDSDRRRR